LVAEDPRGGGVKLELLLDREKGALHVESVIRDALHRQRSVGDEVVEPAAIELRLQKDTLVLEAEIDRDGFPVCLPHGDTRCERAGVEQQQAVGEPDLRILRILVLELLPILATTDMKEAEARRELLVIFPIAERAIWP